MELIWNICWFFLIVCICDLGKEIPAVISKDNQWLKIEHDPSKLEHRPPQPDDSWKSPSASITNFFSIFELLFLILDRRVNLFRVRSF